MQSVSNEYKPEADKIQIVYQNHSDEVFSYEYFGGAPQYGIV